MKNVNPTAPPSYKRHRCFWEPVFAPESTPATYKLFDWDTKHIKALEESACTADELKSIVKGPRHTIRGVSFKKCDFKGDFSFAKLTFKDCNFELCDFTDSVWHTAKFTACELTRTSLSTASFTDCHFNDCTWSQIGMSSNEMHLENTRISNPYDFVCSAYTNTEKDVLEQKGTDPSYQEYRLEGTKTKIARLVLTNQQSQGDDDAFYDAVRTYTTQVIRTKIQTQRYTASKSQHLRKTRAWGLCFAYRLEFALLVASGHVNGWGSSVGRALLWGAGLITFFWLVYILASPNSVAQSALAAIEVTLLIGYTKYTTTAIGIGQQFIYALNMILGLWWYSIFVPTVINRINRTK